MISFGSESPEALFFQRMIATVIPSAPFIVFIYLVFTSTIFRKNDEKEIPVKKNWSLAQIASAFACVCLFFFLSSGILIDLYFLETHGQSMAACSRMETDAKSTIAALVDYYSDPDHMALPSVEQIIEETGLSLYNSVTIEGDPQKVIVVTVTDDSAKCPKGKKMAALFGGEGEMEWKD